MSKKYRLLPEQNQRLVPPMGACFATDMIAVEGKRVGFMYRESPDFDVDRGWRFFAGLETDEYVNDPGNNAIFEVNTIANYDPDIIPFLEAPLGSAFERDGTTGKFESVCTPSTGKSPAGIWPASTRCAKTGNGLESPP